MSKPKFKIGDRVKLDGGEYCLAHYGIPKKYAKKIGTVFHQDERGSTIVEFDDGFRYYAPNYLCVAINEKIIIYRNGAEVVAKNTATGKTGVAKCNPADEFDFNIGAKLAFERLTNPEPEKPKYYSGKVVCTKSSLDDFKVGKVYEFIDGRITDECGMHRPIGYRLTSLKDDKCFMITYNFIPLIED